MSSLWPLQSGVPYYSGSYASIRPGAAFGGDFSLLLWEEHLSRSFCIGIGVIQRLGNSKINLTRNRRLCCGTLISPDDQFPTPLPAGLPLLHLLQPKFLHTLFHCQDRETRGQTGRFRSFQSSLGSRDKCPARLRAVKRTNNSSYAVGQRAAKAKRAKRI